MTETDVRQKLAKNLASVRNRINAACHRAGRSAEEVTLVAVTKFVSPRFAVLIHELGVNDLGESRPQELWRKAAALPKDVRWHLIGHLQRNKIEKTVPLSSLIHSVDSVRLCEAISKWCEKQGKIADILIEVNLSGETAKTGMPPHVARDTIAAWAQMRGIRLLGLMTMAALQDPEACRPTFRALRQLRHDLQEGAAISLPILSMGMSNDFELAIEEGATIVRIGSCLWEEVPEELLQS
jgi:pyridoxal phosphate enzyme (YggS family)